MASISSNDEFFASLRKLVDAWCERRCLGPLARILGPYLGFNGMTDGWTELYDALRSIRASDRDALHDTELELIGDLIRVSEKIVFRR
jgi:hypothetical protein